MSEPSKDAGVSAAGIKLENSPTSAGLAAEGFKPMRKAFSEAAAPAAAASGGHATKAGAKASLTKAELPVEADLSEVFKFVDYRCEPRARAPFATSGSTSKRGGGRSREAWWGARGRYASHRSPPRPRPAR
jgi:hypothetical protein